MRRRPLSWILVALHLSACALGAAERSAADTGAIPIDFPQPNPTSPLVVTTSIRLSPVALQYAPPLPLRSVTVAPGTNVVFSIGAPDADLVAVSWFKNGQPLGLTSWTLEVPAAAVGDAGTYSARYAPGKATERLILRVEAPRRQRALNLSTRARISPAQPFFISGFVVSPSAAGAPEQKALLIRAVGPALSQYGVTDALADPEITVFAGDGSVVPPPVTIAVYPGPVEQATERVGAFPLPLGEKNVAALYFLGAGVYSIRVASAHGGSGTVLLEIYDVPE